MLHVRRHVAEQSRSVSHAKVHPDRQVCLLVHGEEENRLYAKHSGQQSSAYAKRAPGPASQTTTKAGFLSKFIENTLAPCLSY